MDTKRKLMESFMFIIAAIFIFCVTGNNNAGAVQQAAALEGIKTDSKLIQFKSGNHIVGFAPNKAYLASIDHALSVEFLGTKGVTPRAEKNVSSNKVNKALPFGKVRYENLWEGISLTYEATKEGISESTYHVAPKADVSKIRLKYNVPVQLQKDGSLRFKFEKGYMTESAPVAWQEIKGKRIPVKVSFRENKGEIGFRAEKYDPRYQLVIDPVYSWHTFYGNSSIDWTNAIALDGSGNIYITGYSEATWGSPLHAHSGAGDIVVLKLNSSGAYQWHTFYGGVFNNDSGMGLALDGSGNIYIAGSSETAWGSPLHAHSGGVSDIVVLKLNGSGAYQWHTFYGGSSEDQANAVALDNNGNVYVTGSSSATWGSPLHAYRGIGANIVALKLNSSGAYQWHTFYGSSLGADQGLGIAVGGSSDVYVSGSSSATWGSPLHAHSGSSANIVVLKLNSSGAYQWHTYYGSSDWGCNIVLDSNDNIYVTGFSGATWGSPINGHSGGYDIYVLKLGNGGVYQWHTFYGSSGDDQGLAIALDDGGNIYVTGYSTATWGSPLNAYSGSSSDIVLLKLSNSGMYQWHTFYGGIGYEGTGHNFGQAIALDGSGNIYVTGQGADTWGTPLHAYSGFFDIFVLKMAQSFDVRANAKGSGAGIVVSTPAGISYKYPVVKTDSGLYSNGSTVKVTARANTGSKVSWNGTCKSAGGAETGNGTGTAICAIKVVKAAAITATFTQYYAITAKSKGTGAGSVVSAPAGIKYKYPAKMKDSGLFKKGSAVTVTARANAGSKASWNKTCITAGGKETGNNTRTAVCAIKMVKKAGVITATFKK